MECTVARTLARDLYYKKIFPTNLGWFRPEKSTWEIAAASAYDIYEGFQRKEQLKQWLWQSVLRTHTTQSISSYDGPAHAIWSQSNADLVDCRSAPGKKSGYATWKLELCSSSAHNGPTTRTTCSHWSFTMYIYIKYGIHTCRWQAHIQNINGQPAGGQKQSNNWIHIPEVPRYWLSERGVERGSTQQSSLKGWKGAIVNQTNMGTSVHNFGGY